MILLNILVITPFRKGKLIESVVSNIMNYEVVNTAPLQLCTYLKSQGHDVEYISMQNIFRSYKDEDYERLKLIIHSCKFDVLVFHTDYYMNNTNTATIFSIKLISDIVKKMDKNKRIIYCGKLTEMLEDELLQLLPSIDIAIRGESELVINSFIEEKNINFDNYKKFNGCLLNIDKKIVNSRGVNYIDDYNKLPAIDFSFLDKTIYLIEKYIMKVTKLPISIRTSYGCPYACNFCKNTKDWNKYRVKSSLIIRKEIENLKRSCNGKLELVFLSDELFTLNKKHVIEVCKVFEDNEIILNGLFSHLNNLNEEMIKYISRISRSILLGLESCNNTAIKYADKNININNIFKLAKLVKENKMAIGLEWIIGLPGTTIEDELRDLNAMYIFIANNIVDFIEPYILVPHPNTEFCKNNLKYNIEITNCYEEMLEEGGIPQISYNELNRKQIYVLYLISNIVISEAYKAQGHIKDKMIQGDMNIKEFKKIMELFNE